MKITDAFLGEHGVFYAQLDDLEAALVEEELACIQRRARLLAAALEPHATLENELLFDVLEAAAPDGAGVLLVMRDEHDEIEQALHAIQATSDVARASLLLRDMIRTAREHFEKEELVAFPLAEERLTFAELEALGSRWAARRGVRLTNSVTMEANPAS